ncbi:unnamed protein product [Urochloa humidicola]
MATKTIWGRSQTLAVWAVDTDSAAGWKLRRNEHFEKMIQSRLNHRMAELNVEIVEKEGYQYQNLQSSVATSGVTSHAGPPPNAEGVGDTCTSPQMEVDPVVEVDWDSLIIFPQPDQDGEANVLADEDTVFEAMGFKVADQTAEEEIEAPIPSIPPELEQVISDVAIDVDDTDPTEPMMDWDRDNPDMSVGTIYPCMTEFRLAVRQHAIVHEFELGTEKTDKTRFRGFCKANGCPWIIRARTQADKSVRKKSDLGAADIKSILEDKYNIEIKYQTAWYGRQRAADKLFGKWDDCFDWLYRFKAEVELRAPGSVVEIHTVKIDEKEHFSRFFCAFKGSIDGFLEGCRPYISIDSTALNGQWNGHMPAALALDGHNWMFPLAFGLFDSENKDNWIWFMEQLHKAIGDMPHLAICTDACKGLKVAVKQVFPWAERRECFKHLMENMKKNFTGEVYGENMWPAARAYSTGKHKYFLTKF